MKQRNLSIAIDTNQTTKSNNKWCDDRRRHAHANYYLKMFSIEYQQLGGCK